MKKFSVLFLVSFINILNAQELVCKVTVNATANSTSVNPRIFKTLEKSISEFMNNSKWADETYTFNQKIPCNLIVNITDMSKQDIFKADITIQSERPVYNSSYSSQVVRHLDKNILFGYIENDPILYSENQFNSNLASTLAYYAHLIIGLDLETFSPKGGQSHLEKCQNLCLIVPSGSAIGGEQVTGWQPSEAQGISGQRTKIGIIQTYLNPRMDKFRLAVYKYHIQGLDLMADSSSSAIVNIEKAINDISENFSSNNHYIINHFVLAKVDEIINVFSSSSSTKRKAIGTIMTKIEPYTSEKVGKTLMK